LVTKKNPETRKKPQKFAKKVAKKSISKHTKPKPKQKLKDSVMLDIPLYPQTEEFTSSAASAMMVIKYLNPAYKLRKEEEFVIWQEAVNGSVWHGSKYGLAYALGKRIGGVGIVSNTKDEGYERKLAVYENINLDTLTASFNEIRQKSQTLNISEEQSEVTTSTIKKALSSNQIPIVLIDVKAINSIPEPSPHWVVVKGYDKDAFYINDPYSNSTISIDTEVFKAALGFDNDKHMVYVDSRAAKRKKG
jgi:hypothetical protein